MSAAADNLRVERVVEGGRQIVSFSGELDIATVPMAEQGLADGADVLDLSELEFMDSSGVKVLLRACGNRPKPLVVRGARRGVRRILEMTGVSDLLVFEEATTDRVR